MIALEQWRKAARFHPWAGHRIACWAPESPDPDKPWLLLIHGFPTSSWDWSALWQKLEPHFNLAALDMLGFGLSDKPANVDYSILHQADLQEALLERVGAGEAHVFAHDYGDTVAQELLARHYERSLSFALKSVVFLNGGLFPEQHRVRPLQRLGLSPLGPALGRMMTKEKLRRNFNQIFGPDTPPSAQEVDAHWAMLTENNGRRILHKLMHYIPERRTFRARWVGALKEAGVPLRLIDGGKDPVSGKHMYEHYRQEVPNPDAVLFDDIGHYPHTEAPQRVFDAFLEFHKQLGTVKS